MRTLPDAAVLALAGLLAGCAGAPKPDAPPRQAAKPAAIEHAPSAPPVPAPIVGGARPVGVHVPSAYRAETPAPLVVMLHALGVNGELEEWFFRLRPHADARAFLYVAPDGTQGKDGRRFWNAIDGQADVDDVGYLTGLVDEIAARWSIDRKRVYLVGHSNGGMMAHRLACAHPERFAAIASVAGAIVSSCAAKEPVAALEVHGTEDQTVRYDGGTFFGKSYTAAKKTAETWAQLAGCALSPIAPALALDLDLDVEGEETSVLRWSDGCKPGGHAELWTMRGSGHVPTPTSALGRGIVDFLFAHAKP